MNHTKTLILADQACKSSRNAQSKRSPQRSLRSRRIYRRQERRLGTSQPSACLRVKEVKHPVRIYMLKVAYFVEFVNRPWISPILLSRRELLGESGCMLPRKKFPILPSKTQFPAFLRLEIRFSQLVEVKQLPIKQFYYIIFMNFGRQYKL